jgi:hypothetical protein
MNKDKFMACLDDEATDKQIEELNTFIIKRVEQRPISNETLEYIEIILNKLYPKGICTYRNLSNKWRYKDTQLWCDIAEQAAAFISNDSIRIEIQGGYPSDILIDDYREGRIYIAGIDYNHRPELTIIRIDDAIERMISDERFWYR